MLWIPGIHTIQGRAVPWKHLAYLFRTAHILRSDIIALYYANIKPRKLIWLCATPGADELGGEITNRFPPSGFTDPLKGGPHHILIQLHQWRYYILKGHAQSRMQLRSHYRGAPAAVIERAGRPVPLASSSRINCTCSPPYRHFPQGGQ